MQQTFLQRGIGGRLAVFFAGWGMDENPFADFRSPDSDILLCCDYRSLDFPAAILEPYDAVRVVAWSLGVWAAAALMAEIPRLAEDAVAFNGTPFPVDETRGIPPAIFQGTLQGLSRSTLARFDRRMCGDASSLAQYNLVHPRRTIDSLADELAWIGRESAVRSVAPTFRRAAAGSRDAIIACANQRNAWEGLCPVDEVETAHYDRETLRALVCGEVRHG
jgi:biotin synthesis protein BioG